MESDRSKEVYVCDEFVQAAYQEFSADTVANLLLPIGFLKEKVTQYAGSLDIYVFLHGNADEVYTKAEIDFIDTVDKIFVFSEFYKKTRKSIISCRVIATRMDYQDALSAGIAFTKIINKACDGLNLCFIMTEEGFLLTCRNFNERSDNGYYISEFIKTAEQYESLVYELMYAPMNESFVEYYSYMKDVIRYRINDKRYGRNRGIPYYYIETLQEIERDLHISFSGEIERCFWMPEDETEITYAKRVEECEEYLFKIESSKVNTIEMLFEAEEMERLASEAEQKNAQILHNNAREIDNNMIEIDCETKDLLDNPEKMIKLLRKERGL